MNVLLMPFLDDSQSYTYGFEAGMLWIQMTESEVFNKRSIRAENIEQIKLMCDHFGYEYDITESEVPGWYFLTAKPIDISSLNTTKQ